MFLSYLNVSRKNTLKNKLSNYIFVQLFTTIPNRNNISSPLLQQGKRIATKEEEKKNTKCVTWNQILFDNSRSFSSDDHKIQKLYTSFYGRKRKNRIFQNANKQEYGNRKKEKIQKLLKLLDVNRKKEKHMRNLVLSNYVFLVTFLLCVICLLSTNVMNDFIVLKINKILQEVHKSKDIEEGIQKILNNALQGILQDPKNQKLTSLFFLNILKQSEKEIGNLFIQILSSEMVERKLKNIFYDISLYLCNHSEIQKKVAYLLVQAIYLPSSVDASTKWLVELFNSEYVVNHVRKIIVEQLLENTDMLEKSMQYAEHVLCNTLKSKHMKETTSELLVSVIANQQFQQKLSHNFWNIIKLTISPKWRNQEDFKEAMKESTEKNEKQTEEEKPTKEEKPIIGVTDEEEIKEIKETNRKEPVPVQEEERILNEMKKVLSLYEPLSEKETYTQKQIMNMYKNRSEKNKETLINENELQDEILKESFINILELSILINALKYILDEHTNIIPKVHSFLYTPFSKVIDFKGTYRNSLSTHMNVFMNLNKDKIQNSALLEKTKSVITSTLPKPTHYSMDEKMRLLLIDMFLFYSYKYYFYYYYLDKIKTIIYKILTLKPV